MAQKANMIGKYAGENGNAAALIKRFKALHDIWESTVRLFKKALPALYKNHVVGVVKHIRHKMQLLNSQSTLKPGNTNFLLRI